MNTATDPRTTSFRDELRIMTLQAHILEQQAHHPQAGGKAVAGPGRRILDVGPAAIHQRTAVVLGAADQVDAVLAHLSGRP